MRYKLICLFLLLGFGANAQYLHMLERADSSSRKVVVTNNSGIQRYVTIDSLQSLLDDFSYTNAQIDSFINLLVRYTDTASMLEPYITELEINDTLSVYYTSAQVDSADALRVLYTDTAGMLSSYITTLEARSEINDTANVLRNEIGAKADTTITNLLRNDVDRIDLTYNPNSQPILNKHYREVDKQTIYIEEINNAAQGVSRLLNTTLTSGRNAYQDAEVVWMADNSDSTVTYSNKGADFTLSRNGNIYGKDNEGAWFEWMANYPNIDFQENKQKAGLRLFSYIDYGFYRSRVEADTGTLYSIDTCTQNKIDMSLSSSITMIPDGAKAGKLYSIFPNDGSGDFSVTRATTATRVNAEGLIEEVAANVPRIDHTNGCPDLLIEPQRTNYNKRSNNFQSSPWIKIENGTATMTITPNYDTVAGLPATRLVTSGSGDSYSTDYAHIVDVSNANPGINNSVFSYYVKSNTGGNQEFSTYINGGNPIENSQGTSVGVLTATPEWQRVWVLTGPAANRQLAIGCRNTPDIDISIAAVNHEEGGYPTSYIPTEGTTVTRNADEIELTGAADLLGDSEGTLFFEASIFDDTYGSRIALSDGSNNNRFTFELDDRLTLLFVENGSAQEAVNVTSAATISNNLFYKIAGAYKLNDVAVAFEGVVEYTNNSNSVFSDGTLTDVRFDSGNVVTSLFYGRIRQLAVFPTRLTNTQLENITQ